jgi:hypothetical protein
VYVFVKPGGGWAAFTGNETAKLTASDGGDQNHLGWPVADTATLSNGGSATINASGLASVTATANTIAGQYQVTAQLPIPSTAIRATDTQRVTTFSLTNDPSQPIPLLGGAGFVGFALLVLACGALALTRWRLGG